MDPEIKIYNFFLKFNKYQKNNGTKNHLKELYF